MPTPILTPTPTPTPTPTATATATLTPTPTATPDLTQEIAPAEHIAFIWWEWYPDERERGFKELEVAFTIHIDPVGLPDGNGFYFMVCYGKIADIAFYFGLQTDEQGKRAIFSRWGERDLSRARVSTQDGVDPIIGSRRGLHRGAAPFGLGGRGDYIARPGPRRR